MGKDDIRIQRKTAIGMEQLMKMYINSMGLAPGLNTQRIFKAWDEASGAESFTLNRFFRDGTLFITTSSSVVRNQLSFQIDDIAKKMNELLLEDSLFTKDNKRVGLVKNIVLK